MKPTSNRSPVRLDNVLSLIIVTVAFGFEVDGAVFSSTLAPLGA
jgi:hypothetical protein